MNLDDFLGLLFMAFAAGAYCGSVFETARVREAAKGGWLFVARGKRYKIEETD